MKARTLRIVVTSAAAGVGLAVGVAVLANAASGTTAPSPTATSSARPGDGPGGGPGGGMRHQHTPVTGAEADRVKAAVTAKDSAVTVVEVRKDPDGSYDVLGTKAGAPVKFEVSTDLKTVTRSERGPGGHRHGLGHGPGHGPGAPDGNPGTPPSGAPSGGASDGSTTAPSGSQA